MAHDNLASRPTGLYEIEALLPTVNDATDAAGPGMGGVIFHVQSDNPVCLWRARFPSDMVNSLASVANPQDTATNSDFKLAGTLTQHDVIAHHWIVRKRTTHTALDNTPAVAWQHSGFVTYDQPASYILRF